MRRERTLRAERTSLFVTDSELTLGVTSSAAEAVSAPSSDPGSPCGDRNLLPATSPSEPQKAGADLRPCRHPAVKEQEAAVFARVKPMVPPEWRERCDSTRPGPFASMMCSGPEGMGSCGMGAIGELVNWDEAVR